MGETFFAADGPKKKVYYYKPGQKDPVTGKKLPDKYTHALAPMNDKGFDRRLSVDDMNELDDKFENQDTDNDDRFLNIERDTPPSKYDTSALNVLSPQEDWDKYNAHKKLNPKQAAMMKKAWSEFKKEYAKCPKCGAIRDASDKFCDNCSHVYEDVIEAAPRENVVRGPFPWDLNYTILRVDELMRSAKQPENYIEFVLYNIRNQWPQMEDSDKDGLLRQFAPEGTNIRELYGNNTTTESTESDKKSDDEGYLGKSNSKNYIRRNNMTTIKHPVKNKSMKKAGEDPNLPNAPEPDVYYSDRGRATKRAVQRRSPSGVRGGMAEDFKDAHARYRCPRCKGRDMLIVNDKEACDRCGYHNIPHAGTPKKMKPIIRKAWMEFKKEEHPLPDEELKRRGAEEYVEDDEPLMDQDYDGQWRAYPSPEEVAAKERHAKLYPKVPGKLQKVPREPVDESEELRNSELLRSSEIEDTVNNMIEAGFEESQNIGSLEDFPILRSDEYALDEINEKLEEFGLEMIVEYDQVMINVRKSNEEREDFDDPTADVDYDGSYQAYISPQEREKRRQIEERLRSTDESKKSRCPSCEQSYQPGVDTVCYRCGTMLKAVGKPKEIKLKEAGADYKPKDDYFKESPTTFKAKKKAEEDEVEKADRNQDIKEIYAKKPSEMSDEELNNNIREIEHRARAMGGGASDKVWQPRYVELSVEQAKRDPRMQMISPTYVYDEKTYPKDVEKAWKPWKQWHDEQEAKKKGDKKDDEDDDKPEEKDVKKAWAEYKKSEIILDTSHLAEDAKELNEIKDITEDMIAEDKAEVKEQKEVKKFLPAVAAVASMGGEAMEGVMKLGENVANSAENAGRAQNNEEPVDANRVGSGLAGDATDAYKAHAVKEAKLEAEAAKKKQGNTPEIPDNEPNAPLPKQEAPATTGDHSQDYMKNMMGKAWNDYKHGPERDLTDDEKTTCPKCNGKNCEYDQMGRTIRCLDHKCEFSGPAGKKKERTTKPWWEREG